jgi:quinol---cytochrome-c reductase cytochrome c subunit
MRAPFDKLPRASRARPRRGCRQRWPAPLASATQRLLALVALALLGGGGFALAQPPDGIVRPDSEPAGPTVTLGHQLFEANCASCHGGDGQGIAKPRPGAGDIEGAAPSLHGVGELAADFYLRTGFMPLGSIHEQPSNHHVLFTDKEIRSLDAFVASLGRGPGIPHPDPGAATLARGFKLFTEDCAGCHQSLARGGFVTGARVPPLQGIGATQIAEAVRVGPYLMPRFSARQIGEGELNAIVNYVLSTNRPENRGGWSIGNLGPIPEGLIAWLAAIVLGVICLGLGRRLRA